MEVRLDVSLNEMETALEDGVKVIFTTRSLLCHYWRIVKRKFPHLKVILFEHICHHGIHPVFHRYYNCLIVKVAHQKATDCRCLLEFDNSGRFLRFGLLLPLYDRCCVSLKFWEDQIKCLVLVGQDVLCMQVYICFRNNSYQEIVPCQFQGW